MPGDGQVVVGVALTPAQAPGLDSADGRPGPRRGDTGPGRASCRRARRSPATPTVVGVHVSEETGQTIVDLLVPHADAAVLAARVATGNVALVLDSRER